MRTKINKIDIMANAPSEWPIVIERFTINNCYMPHWHGHYEMQYIIEGEGHLLCNGVLHEVKPDNILFITPTDFHELSSDAPLAIIKISFTSKYVDNDFLNTLTGISRPVIDIPEHSKEFFQTLFNLLFEKRKSYENNPPDKFSPYCIESLKKNIDLIIINIIEQLTNSNPDTAVAIETNTDDTQKILSYIHQNFRSQITLEKLAEHVHFSPNYLSRYFSKTMGMNYKRYVTNLRMDFAAKLLINTDLQITDICYESGFGSLPNFVKEFKKYYSISPTEYRNKSRKDS